MSKNKNLKNISIACKKLSEAIGELGSSFQQVAFIFSKINKDLKTYETNTRTFKSN